MVNMKVAVINESTVLTDYQVQSPLPALKTQAHRDFASGWGSEHSERILCCYVNATKLIQIARSANISNWYFERVVFPGERLLFEALPDAQLEIHTCMTGSKTFLDRITCNCLRLGNC